MVDSSCELCEGKGRFKVVHNPNWETIYRCRCQKLDDNKDSDLGELFRGLQNADNDQSSRVP